MSELTDRKPRAGAPRTLRLLLAGAVVSGSALLFPAVAGAQYTEPPPTLPPTTVDEPTTTTTVAGNTNTPPATVAGTSVERGLALTGGDVAGLAAIGGGALAAGAALVVVSRRRRQLEMA